MAVSGLTSGYPAARFGLPIVTKGPEMTMESVPAIPNATPTAGHAYDVLSAPAEIMRAAREPRRSNKGVAEKYPFARLAVDEGFFVPATEAMPDPAKTLASTVSSAKARYAEETGETETVTVKEYAVDERGVRLKDGDGHYIVKGESEITRPKMRPTRMFKIVPADSGAWVVRTA